VDSVIIYGNGAVARTAYYCLANDSPYQVAALTVDRAVLSEPRFLGLPVIAFDEIERHFAPGSCRMFIAVGFRDVNQLRAERYRQAKEKGYGFITYVSSRAVTCPDLSIGDNGFIAANVVVQPSVEVGHNVVIRDNTFVGHDTTIGDHCYVGASAVILGGATVEPYCLVGANATIRDGVRLGRASVIGAGVTLLHDAQEKDVYVNKGAQKLPLASDQL
jgi:sugar O-acyltransferase (sialic acid O-acetyltransferase NeuD family)